MPERHILAPFGATIMYVLFLACSAAADLARWLGTWFGRLLLNLQGDCATCLARYSLQNCLWRSRLVLLAWRWHTQATDDVCVVQVGGEVDKLCETKGLDFVDREKAKRHAREQVSQVPPCSGNLHCRLVLLFWPRKSKRACSDSTMGKYRPILPSGALLFCCFYWCLLD